MLGALNRSVTTGITEADVTGTWAGLRPLVKSGRRPAARPTSPASTVSPSPPRVWSASRGGKLTTYRRMAADTVDAVMCGWTERGDRGRGSSGCSVPTATRSRSGSDARTRISPGATGRSPADVEALIARHPDLGQPIVPGSPTSPPRPCTPCPPRDGAARWTTSCPGAPGPACSTAAPRPTPRRGRPPGRARNWAGTRPSRLARSAASPSLGAKLPVGRVTVSRPHPSPSAAPRPRSAPGWASPLALDRRGRGGVPRGLPGHGDRSGRPSREPAATGGHCRCTGRWPARSEGWRAAVCRPADADQVAAVLRTCNERARPGHRGGRTQRRVRGQRSPLRRRRHGPHRPWRASSTSTTRASPSTSCRAPSAPISRRELRRTAG